MRLDVSSVLSFTAPSHGRAPLHGVAPSPAQACSPAWRSRWRSLQHDCIDRIPATPAADERASGPHSRMHALEWLGNGHVRFLIESRTRNGTRVAYGGGDSYRVWLRKWPRGKGDVGVMGAAYVRDVGNGLYLAVARLPEAGEYEVTIQLDWAACAGVVEAGALRNDSSLAFSTVFNPEQEKETEGTDARSERVRAQLRTFAALEARYTYLGERAVLTLVVAAEHLRPARQSGCAPLHVLAPGAYVLRWSEQLALWSSAWLPPPCQPSRACESAGRGRGPLRLSRMTHIGLLGDSRLRNLAACLEATDGSESGLCGQARRSPSVGRGFGIEASAWKAWRELRSIHVTMTGLHPDPRHSMTLVSHMLGYACQWSSPAGQAGSPTVPCDVTPPPMRPPGTNLDRLMEPDLTIASRCKYRYTTLPAAWAACRAHPSCIGVAQDGGLMCATHSPPLGATEGAARAGHVERHVFELRRGTPQRNPAQRTATYVCEARLQVLARPEAPFALSPDERGYEAQAARVARLCRRAAANITAGEATGEATVLLVLNCGAHCVQRTPFRAFQMYIDGVVEAMVAAEASGVARWAYATSAALHEHTYHYATADPPIPRPSPRPPSGHERGAHGGRESRVRERGFGHADDPVNFAVRRWRLTDARLRLFDGYAEDVMARHGIQIIDHYWPTLAWPKIHPRSTREPEEHKAFPAMAELSQDSRHHAPTAHLGAIAQLPW